MVFDMDEINDRINQEINRIEADIVQSYSAIEEQGGTLPETMDMDGMASAIRSIPKGVTSFHGRTGDVVPQAGDYTPELIGAASVTHTHTVDQISGIVTETMVDQKIDTRVNAIVDGAPEAYDTLKEVSEYIEAHQTVYEALQDAVGKKVDKTTCINGHPLTGDIQLVASDISGVPTESDVIERITAASNALKGTISEIDGYNTITDLGFKVHAAEGNITDLYNTRVPTTRRINGYSLTNDVTLTYANVGAAAASHTHSASDIVGLTTSGVPTSRTINGYSLASNITLTAADVGARPKDSSSAVDNSVALGNACNALNTYAVSIGYSCNANSKFAVAIGGCVTAGAGSAIAIGEYASARGESGIAIGGAAEAAASLGIAIGDSAVAAEAQTVALGNSASAKTETATALGPFTTASGMYSTAIGYEANTSGFRTIRLGADRLSALECAVSLSVTSDMRDKSHIENMEDGATEFLSQIRTVRYRRNERTRYMPSQKEMSLEDQELFHKYGMCSYDREAHTDGTKEGSRVRVGVLAQEVQEALQNVYGDASYANLVNDNFFDMDPDTIPEGVENRLTVSYENFIPFLIKGFQEMHNRVQRMEALLHA